MSGEQNNEKKSQQQDADRRKAKKAITERYDKNNHHLYMCTFPMGDKECGELFRFPQMNNHIGKHWGLYRIECRYCSDLFVDNITYTVHIDQKRCNRATVENAIQLPIDKNKEVDVYRSLSLFVKPLSSDQQRVALQRLAATKPKKKTTPATPCYDDEQDMQIPSSSGTSVLVNHGNVFEGPPRATAHEAPRQSTPTAPPLPAEFAPNQPPPHPDMLHFATSATNYWTAAQYQEYHRTQGGNGNNPGVEYGSNSQFNGWEAAARQSQRFQSFQQPAAPFRWNQPSYGPTPVFQQQQQENPRTPGQVPTHNGRQSNHVSRPNPLVSIHQMPAAQNGSSTHLEDPRLQRTKLDSAGPRDPRTAASTSAAPFHGLRDAPRAHEPPTPASAPHRQHRERQSSQPALPEPSTFTNDQCNEEMSSWPAESVDQVKKQYAPRRGSTSFSGPRSETMRAEPSTSTSSRTSHEGRPAARSSAQGERRERTPHGLCEESSRGPAHRTRSKSPIAHMEQISSRRNMTAVHAELPSTSRARSGTPNERQEASTSGPPRPNANRARRSTPIGIQPVSNSRPSRTPTGNGVPSGTRRDGTPVRSEQPSTSSEQRSAAPRISMPHGHASNYDPASNNRARRSASSNGNRAPSTSGRRTRESTPNQNEPSTSSGQPRPTGTFSLKPVKPERRSYSPTSVNYKNRSKSPIANYGPDTSCSYATRTTAGAPSKTSRSPFLGAELQRKQTSQAEILQRRQGLLSKMTQSKSGAQSSAAQQEHRDRAQNGERSEDGEPSEERSSRKRDTSSPDDRDYRKRNEKRRK